MMRKGFLALVFLASIILRDSTTPLQAQALPLQALPLQSAKFRFALPHGLEYTEKVRTVVLRSRGQEKVHDVTESLTRCVVLKTAQGYLIKATPVTVSMRRNGQIVNNPALQLLIGRTITYKVSPQGVLQDILGYEKLLADVQKSFGPEVQKAMAAALSPQAVRRREEAEWRGRITDYVGRSVKAGEQWKSQAQFALPTGPITYHVITRFPQIKRQGPQTLVTTRFSYDSDAKAAGQLAERVAKDLSKGIPNGASWPAPKIGAVKISGQGERVVDAQTMFIVSEKLQRTLHFPVEVPGQGKVMQTVQESKQYQFNIIKKGR